MKQPKSLVVCLAGPLASGKSTVADFLEKQFRFKALRSREFLENILVQRGELVTERALQDLGERTAEELGEHGICELIMQGYDPYRSYVVDSLRHARNITYFRDRFGDAFRLLYVAAPPELRLQRYIGRGGHRSNTVESYNERVEHPVERDVPGMLNESHMVVLNRDLEVTLGQVTSLILQCIYGRRLTMFQEMIEAVKSFHRKHGFGIADQDMEMMQYRMGLLIEELGEINECISKGTGDIGEEHADLFVLLLSNCLTMGIDIEERFWSKYKVIMRRPPKRVPNRIRVAGWSGGRGISRRDAYTIVDYRSLLEKDENQEDNDDESPTQVSFFE